MSHTVKIGVTLTKEHFPSAIKAAEELGLVLRRDEQGKPMKTMRGWQGRRVPCALAFGVPEQERKQRQHDYEIGLVAEDDTTYRWALESYNLYDPDMTARIGSRGEKLNPLTSFHHTCNVMTASGHELTETEVLASGETVYTFEEEEGHRAFAAVSAF